MTTYAEVPIDNYSTVVDLSRVHFAPTPFDVTVVNERNELASARLIGWHSNLRQVFLTPRGCPAILPGWEVGTIW